MRRGLKTRRRRVIEAANEAMIPTVAKASGLPTTAKAMIPTAAKEVTLNPLPCNGGESGLPTAAKKKRSHDTHGGERRRNTRRRRRLVFYFQPTYKRSKTIVQIFDL